MVALCQSESSHQIVIRPSHRVVGCLLKKDLQRGEGVTGSPGSLPRARHCNVCCQARRARSPGQAKIPYKRMGLLLYDYCFANWPINSNLGVSELFCDFESMVESP